MLPKCREPFKNAFKLSLFSKYWVVNQTGLPLRYRPNSRSERFGDVDKRQIDLSADPRTWYFDKSLEFKAQMAAQKFYYPFDELQISVCDSDWSNAIQLDNKKGDNPKTIVVSHHKSSKTFAFTYQIHTAPGRVRPFSKNSLISQKLTNTFI